MLYAHKIVNLLILITLWLNPVMASEQRPHYSVPKYHQTQSTSFAIFPLLGLGKFAGAIPHLHIRLPNFGKLFENIDFSCATKIVEEHKVMLGVATSVVFLSLLVKQLQKSEQYGKWLQEKYIAAEKSVDGCANSCIDQCPMPVRLAITPIKILLQFLCNAIKKYVAMNNGTIVYSAVAPVAGRLLDSVLVCPIPLLTYTSVGGIVSGVVLTKGYFDSNFTKVNERFDGIEKKIDQADAKNVQEHSVTQNKIGLVQTAIDTINDNITNLFSKIKRLRTGVNEVKEQVANVLEEVAGTKDEVISLRNSIDLQDKKAVERYEALQKRFDKLESLLYQKTEHNEVLMLELKGFKSIYESNHADLRKDLSTTSTHLNLQIDSLKEDVRTGFASQNKCFNLSDSKDMQIAVLQLQAGQRTANNS